MTLMIDGNIIAKKQLNELKDRVAKRGDTPRFHLIYVGSDPVIDSFVNYKQLCGKELGIEVVLHRFSAEISETELKRKIAQIAEEKEAMIVQLPLPNTFDMQTVLDQVPVDSDVDVLSLDAREAFVSGTIPFVPPVTAAILEVLKEASIDLSGKKICVVGNGNLVGKPTILYLKKHGYTYTLVDKETGELERDEALREADVIISGAGVPGLIHPDQIKDGVVLIDAGTSEAGKKIVGDIDPLCAKKASVMTSVPGGIGPITIAMLYTNVLSL